jgi:hypothetical protein
MNSIKLLLSLIEGPVDTEIYRKIADSLDDFTILKKRLESIYERFLDEELGLPPDAPISVIT